jgi:pyrroloquinoline quinone biosynthesis protein B
VDPGADGDRPPGSQFEQPLTRLIHVAVPAIALACASVLAVRALTQVPSPVDASGWRVVVLGIAQDAGIPQLGCNEGTCAAIRAGRRPRERVASIGLVNNQLHRAYLIDATPDFVSQIGSLTGGRVPDAIFLTHGHIGHYTGLMYLGRESIDAKSVPVYGTARMRAFLAANGPWSLLVERHNIALQPLTPDRAIDLGDGVTVTAFLVPHRDEFTDTVGYRISRPRRTIIYIPDIDRWETWDRSIRDVVSHADLAFLDGTFASADEVPGRSMDEIPHPLMPVTRALLRGVHAAVWFIHVNHTNREIDARDVVKDGMTFLM